MGPTAACRLPREMTAALLQRAMTRGRPVKLTLTDVGRLELVGDVVLLQQGSDVDELARDCPVTVVLDLADGRTPPIALDRIRAAQMV